MTTNRQLIIDPDARKAIDDFVAPTELGFGAAMAPVIYQAKFKDGAWSEGHIGLYGPIPVDPAAKALHYAHTIFEGMKAYRVGGGKTTLFRPSNNWKRMVASAKRLLMPEIPESVFMEGVNGMASLCAPIIPGEPGQTLYLRPFMFATEGTIGLSISSTYLFVVIASPSDAYRTKSMSLLVEREEIRAAGNLGSAKAGGNYAASTFATANAWEAGFDQVLWLDPLTRRNIEELSGMNKYEKQIAVRLIAYGMLAAASMGMGSSTQPLMFGIGLAWVFCAALLELIPWSATRSRLLWGELRRTVICS